MSGNSSILRVAVRSSALTAKVTIPTMAARKSDRPEFKCRPGNQLAKVEPRRPPVGIATERLDQAGRRGDGIRRGFGVFDHGANPLAELGKMSLDAGRRARAIDRTAGSEEQPTRPGRHAARPRPARPPAAPTSSRRKRGPITRAISARSRRVSLSQRSDRSRSCRVASSFPIARWLADGSHALVRCNSGHRDGSSGHRGRGNGVGLL